MCPEGRGGDRSRSRTQRGPPATPEAPENRTGDVTPECGFGTHLDTIDFLAMSPWARRGPGVPTPVRRDQTPALEHHP
eukprot:4134675-Alexandrium_andersonii.AAC.1